MKLKKFFRECHEKGVVKMLSIYILSSWIILQVLSVIQDPLGLPGKTITYFILGLLIAFPIYIYGVWKFQLLPMEKQLIKTGEKTGKSKSRFHRMFFTGLGITAFICFLIAFMIGINNFSSQVHIPVLETSNKIAVLEFGNNTGKSENDILGKMAADWIIHGITENKVAEVISPELVTSYASLINKKPSDGDKSFIKEYFKPGKIISGNFYTEGGKLFLQCRMIDGYNDEVIIAFKNQNCDLKEPLDCIENLKQVILSYLTIQENPALTLQDDPPTFEAYQYLLNAKSLNNNKSEYLNLLNKSIEADPNYFEPKVLKVAYYYNLGEYKTADSLRRAIDISYYNDKRQQNLLLLYENLLEGNNARIFSCMMKEYEIAPDELASNSSAMVIALQFVNRPELVDDIYNSIRKNINELDYCQECRSRVYIKGLADIALGRYDQVIDLMLPVVKTTNELYLQRPLLSAYVRSGKDKDVQDYFISKELRLDTETLNSLYLYVSKEYLLKSDAENAGFYMDKIIAADELEDQELKAAAYYFNKNYSEANSLYQKIYKENSNDIKLTGRLAIIQSELGNIQASKELLEKLDSLRKEYQYGAVDYEFAVFYAMDGNWEKSRQYLLRSIAEGNTYNPENFQNDPHFVKYKETPGFQKVLTYWH